MTQLQARSLFSEVHAPCCMYHYAEVVSKPSKDLFDAVKSLINGDAQKSVKNLYELIAILLKEIDHLEGRTYES